MCHDARETVGPRRTRPPTTRQQYEQQQYAQPQAAPVYAPPPQPAPAAGATEDNRINTLKQLGELHAQGILTDEEFAAEKAKVLSS